MTLPKISSAVLASFVLLRVEAAEADPLEAPYQLDGMAVDLRDRGADPAADITFVFLFDIGEAQPTQADVERWTEATVLTEAGPVRAWLLDIRKTCDFLCGVDPAMPVEEAETCHYQAALVLDQKADTGGANLLAAFPGAAAITEFTPAEPAPLASEQGGWSAKFHAPIWPEDAPAAIRVEGWDAAAGRLAYSVKTSEGEQALEERGCRATAAAGLVQIACQSIAILAADGVPLLVSWADYNQPNAVPVASFLHEGERHVLVRLGLKAQTIYGLLIPRGNRWVPLFRPAKRPLLC
jgi:hypothetical protein